MATDLPLIVPEWPAPRNVRAFATTRNGGVSAGPYASLNLGTHVGDDPQAVAENRARLGSHLPVRPLWLQQVHGAVVVNALSTCPDAQADAAFARVPNQICTVMTADCLPVLFCDASGTAVGAAHAGWRGLAGGVLENTVKAMQVEATEVLAWLGPAIGPQSFEVGEDVRAAFVAHSAQAQSAFVPTGAPGKYLADLYLLARQRLTALGVTRIYGGGRCTLTEADIFFSARRDGTRSGRQASLIWLEG